MRWMMNPDWLPLIHLTKTTTGIWWDVNPAIPAFLSLWAKFLDGGVPGYFNQAKTIETGIDWKKVLEGGISKQTIDNLA